MIAEPIDNEDAREAADPRFHASHEGRIPFLHPTDLDSAAEALWQEVIASRGSAVVNAQGGLSGPFNVWLHNPALGSLLTRLGGVLRFDSDLDPRLIELAIVTIAARGNRNSNGGRTPAAPLNTEYRRMSLRRSVEVILSRFKRKKSPWSIPLQIH